MDHLKTISVYFTTCGAPPVYLVPNGSAFALEGPGSDGICQGAGHFIGCYWNICPVLKAEFCYTLYTLCFSTTFLEIPSETIYSELFYRIRPEHWVSGIYLLYLIYFLSFRCIFN